MDDKAEILAAINQLGTAIGRELTELKADVSELKAGQTELKAGQAKLEAGQAALEKRMDRLDIRVDTGFQVIAARLDEQRQTVNSLIPTRIAAVGDKRHG